MFWKFDLHPNSSLDTVLSKDDCTLSEVLDEDDVLQECKSQNRKLLDFLTRPEILDELVDLIMTEPSDDLEEKLRYKYPNIACELLTSDVQVIVDQLTETDVLLEKLWTFLDTEKTLNPLLASFFSKVFSLLVGRKTTLVLQFLKSKENPVDCILRHIDTSAIMDLVLRLTTNVEVNELRSEVLQWLDEERLIQKLVNLVDPRHSTEKICNASQCLCDLVKASREHMSQLQESAFPDPLLSTIENKETLSILLDHMLHEVHLKSSSDSLVGGVSVLLTLLEINKCNSESPFSNVDLGEPVTALDAERLTHGVTTTLSAIVPRLDGFHQILTDPPPMSPMSTTVGILEPPFGKTRLQVLKMFSAILRTTSEEAGKEFAKLGTLEVMWELFFKYPWNNFLHVEVEHCIDTLLSHSPLENDSEHALLKALMKDVNLIKKIIDAFTLQENGTENSVSKRPGYMGHLTKIANNVYKNMQGGKNQEKLNEIYNELDQEDKDRWEQFVSGKLAEINKQNTTDLGGRHPLQSSDDDDDEFRPPSFLRSGNTASYQQAYNHYTLQQMTPEFLENMGFDEEHFPVSDENMGAPFDRIANINFTIETNDENGGSAAFQAVCNERIHGFDDNDSDEEDVWNTKEITFSQNTETRSSPSEESESSESEEEEVEVREEKLNQQVEDLKDFATIRTSSPSPSKEKDDNMDVDSNDQAWTANFESDPVSMDIAQSADPASVGWTSEPSKTGEDNTGWAKFDDIGSISEAAGRSPSNEQRASSPVAMDTEVSSPPPPPSATAGSAYVVDSTEEAEMPEDSMKNEAIANESASNDLHGVEKDEILRKDSGKSEELSPDDKMSYPSTEIDSSTEKPVPLAPHEEEDVEISDLEVKPQNVETPESGNGDKTGLSNCDNEEPDASKFNNAVDSSLPKPECEGTNEVTGDHTSADVNAEDTRGDMPKKDTSGESVAPEKIPVSARDAPTLP